MSERYQTTYPVEEEITSSMEPVQELGERPRKNRRKKRRRRRKKNHFRRNFFIYLIFLLVLGAFLIFRVYKTMQEYQENNINVFVSNTIQELSDEQISQLFTLNETYESGNDLGDNVRSYFKDTDNFQVKKDVDTGIYSVRNLSGEEVLTMNITVVRSINKLGLLNYDILKLESISPTESKQLYHQIIVAPSADVVTINGVTATATSSEGIDGFADGGNYTTLPTMNTYDISGLTAIPEIQITKDGQSVDFEQSTNIELENNITGSTYDSLEAAGCDFNAIGFSEQWTLFMSADLNTEFNGYYDLLNNYFIQGSEQDQKAYAWASGTDITFTSDHVLLDPVFTNESISNVVKYSDTAITVDVTLEKNMLVNGETQPHVDTFHSTLYLVNYNGRWNVVNIRGISSNDE